MNSASIFQTLFGFRQRIREKRLDRLRTRQRCLRRSSDRRWLDSDAGPIRVLREQPHQTPTLRGRVRPQRHRSLDGIVLVNPVLQAFWKQRALPAICPLNEALHPIPHSSARITAGESHEALRFHTARIKSGLRNQSAQCPFYPQ